MKQAHLAPLLLLLGACGGGAASNVFGAEVDDGAVIALEDALTKAPPTEVTLRDPDRELHALGLRFE